MILKRNYPHPGIYFKIFKIANDSIPAVRQWINSRSIDILEDTLDNGMLEFRFTDKLDLAEFELSFNFASEAEWEDMIDQRWRSLMHTRHK